ncbi:hypothetical protein [Rhizobium sp. R693]|uniref:hypothetical protein n=1 Tax=Rhizobium sp. R693 TaxID=1764276 RepID=UPI000B53248B|nr:hypothetical protein [Rhizobium sp. R693]OWV91028.1 hypothetical protein ATY79_06450 [Rhizobium sp. R693]
MGIPLQYSLDIPRRCLDLLDVCEQQIARNEVHARRYGGPLDTTLLLALASQMILLPIERITKHLGGDVLGYTDDRQLLPKVGESLREKIRKRSLRDNAQLAGFDWSFIANSEVFPTSQGVPHRIAEVLVEERAHQAAQHMPMDQFMSCLRNSLAHGGVMYLDGNGYTSHSTAEMLLFVSAKQSRPEPFVDESTGKIVVPQPVTEALRLLRISTKDFRNFLYAWNEWLDETGVSQEIAA